MLHPYIKGALLSIYTIYSALVVPDMKWQMCWIYMVNPWTWCTFCNPFYETDALHLHVTTVPGVSSSEIDVLHVKQLGLVCCTLPLVLQDLHNRCTASLLEKCAWCAAPSYLHLTLRVFALPMLTMANCLQSMACYFSGLRCVLKGI